MERAQLEKIEAGFDEAITLIRLWHGMGAKGAEEREMWDIYYNHSPEMKRVWEARELLKASASVTPVMRSLPSDEDVDRMVNKFLQWKLPNSVNVDPICYTGTSEHRTGTNLLTAIEAKEMIQYLLRGNDA